MRHEEKVAKLKGMHERLLKKLAEHELKALPADVDLLKLEEAYERLKGYEFVLRKVKRQPAKTSRLKSAPINSFM